MYGCMTYKYIDRKLLLMLCYQWVMQRSRKMTFMVHFYATVYSGHTKQNCSLNWQQGSEKEKQFNSIDTEASLSACPSVEV